MELAQEKQSIICKTHPFPLKQYMTHADKRGQQNHIFNTLNQNPAHQLPKVQLKTASLTERII